jgi:hypothetical protein
VLILKENKTKSKEKRMGKKPQISKGTSMDKLGLVNNTNLSIVKSL